MKIKFVDIQRQYKQNKKEINNAIQIVLTKGDFIIGEELKRFESAFAKFCNSKYCVGVASGTDALFISLKVLGITAGDEVIVPANTFIATALAVTMVGATPVFVDMNEHTYNINTNEIESKITKKTKAIIAVHLYGQPAEMDKITAIAKKFNLYIIEDAAQAHGAIYQGKIAGSFGHLAAFSFYPGKNIGAFGDGGAIVTNNKKLADKIYFLRNWGGAVKYHHELKGINSRLDTLQAAILQVKLKHLEKWNKQRREIAAFYTKQLSAFSFIVTPKEAKGAKSIYHLYVIQVPRRDELLNFLNKRGISVGIHYPIPIHMQKAYKELGYKKGDFPLTENYASKIISLPMFPELTMREVSYVVSQISHFYS